MNARPSVRLSLPGVLLAALLGGSVTPVAAATGPAADRTTTDRCDVTVRPGQDAARAVARAGVGATICLRAGTHRLTHPLRPRRDQTILGHGATLDGSKVLRGFSRTRDGWVVRGQRQQGTRHGTCLAGRPDCAYPDDVLRDGRPLRRVLAREALGPGRYWFDYRRDAIHLGGDPSGHRLEGMVAHGAIVSTRAGSGVTVRGVTVRATANPAQHGAIRTGAPGWTIVGTTVRDTHGAGITTQGDARVLRNDVRRNGQLGIGGTGADTVVADNVVVGNGGGGFDPAWEAGGAKWALTDGLVVRGNRVVGNHGPGLWTDIDAQDTTYADNVVTDNDWMGIFHEISADALIADNLVTGNGHGFDTWLWGSGILLAGSHDVEVVGNRLAGNAQGIGLVQQDRGSSETDGTPRRLHHVRVADNRVDLAGGDTGMVRDDDRDDLFDDATITWTGNTWTGLGAAPFHFDDELLSLAQWRALGHDVP